MRTPADWQQAIEHILRSPGTAMVMGQGDVGKTTFCLLLANAGAEAGLSVGVVDADVGQSHIGPPAAIGLGLVEKPVSDLVSIPAEALYFIGSHSPAGHFSRMAVGTAKLVARAKGMGLSPIVVDCGGLSMGKLTWRLAKGELEMVRPEHLVLLKRRRGFEALMEMSKMWSHLTCYQLGLPASIRRKSAARRKEYRKMAWGKYLRAAQRREFSLKEVSLDGVSPEDERRDWTGRIVGLHDRCGECVGLGLITHLDLRASQLEVFTPVGERLEVDHVVFGSQRLRVPLE